jgi:hypothetical protein
LFQLPVSGIILWRLQKLLLASTNALSLEFFAGLYLRVHPSKQFGQPCKIGMPTLAIPIDMEFPIKAILRLVSYVIAYSFQITSTNARDMRVQAKIDTHVFKNILR